VQIIEPRFLIAAALLFWGWQTRIFAFALPMAAVVIASAFARHRFTFTGREFARLWDFTILLVVGAAIYNRQTLSVSGAVITFLQWLPIVLFPFTAAFLFSNARRVPHSTFLFWWRKKTNASERELNPSYPYFAICFVAASAGSARDAWFYPAAVILIAAALASHHRRARSVLALVLFICVTAAGYFLHTRWRDFQGEIESKTIQWFAGFFPKQFEDQEVHTSLGDICKLKSSGRVVMRVRGENGCMPPALYRQVSFDRYRSGIWLSTRRQYSPVTEHLPGTWIFDPTANPTNCVTVCAAVPEGRILLPTPLGCGRVRGLSASRLERNRFGNVRVWDTPDPMECVLDFNWETSHEPPPQKLDLEIHLRDQPVIAQVADELGLASVRPSHALKELEQFFTTQFRYTPVLAVPALAPTDTNSFVAPFLTQTRAGHCEYFATAAVLLLRKAGIPARYAMGYAAVEPTGNQREFRIRERHTHSWALAWIDGRWRDFDPTPQTWNREELQRSSVWRPLSDWWADARFRLATWQPLPGLNGRFAIYLLCPIGVVFAWALLRKRGRFRRQRQRPAFTPSYAWPGLDSEFFLVEASLTKKGFVRKPDETPAAWVSRIEAQRNSVARIAPVIDLHYKYRFDPLGLTAEERAQLAENARAWLAEQEAIAQRHPATRSGRGD
jgi:transglutaminase-like putative cysteine protease